MYDTRTFRSCKKIKNHNRACVLAIVVFPAAFNSGYSNVYSGVYSSVDCAAAFTAVCSIARGSTRLVEGLYILLPPTQSLKLASELEDLSPQWASHDALVPNSAATNPELLHRPIGS